MGKCPRCGEKLLGIGLRKRKKIRFYKNYKCSKCGTI